MLVGIGGVAIPAICCRNRAPSFAPTDLANLSLWVKADGQGAARDGSNNPITTDNTSLAKLWDFSGSSNHLTQSTTALQPLYRSTGNGLAGKPAIQFVNHNVNLASFSRGAWTTFTVFRASTNLGIYFHGPSVFGPSGYLYTDINASIHIRDNTSSIVSAKDYTASWGADNVLKLATVRFNGTHASHILRVNGVGATLTDRTVGDPGTSITTQRFDIGGQNGTGSGSMYLGELLIYTTALSDTDMTKVETYLRNKWNL